MANPLQVVAQLSSLFFIFQWKENYRRHLCLLCLTLSLLGSLYLSGSSIEFLFCIFTLYLIMICVVPLSSTLFLILCAFSFEEALSKWGFFLIFPLFIFKIITHFFQVERACPNKDLNSFFACLTYFLLFGFFVYEDNYLTYPLELAALVSGACIIFCSLKKRARWEFLVCGLIYLSFSILIGLFCSPPNGKNFFFFPYGICIFLLLHLFSFLGFLLFW